MKVLDRSRFFNNLISSFGRQIFTALLNVVTLFLLAKYFGAELNGIYNIALLLPIVLTNFLAFGISSANIYYINTNKISYEQAWYLNLRLGVIISILGLLIGFFSVIFLKNSFFSEVLDTYLYIILLAFPLQFFNNIILSFFQADENFKIFNIILIIQPALMFVFVLILVLLDFYYLGVLLLLYLISFLVTIIYSYKQLNLSLKNKKNKKNKFNLFEIKKDIRLIFSYGLKAHLSNVISFINNKVDLIIINILLGPIYVGLYVVALQFSEKMWMIPQAVSNVMLPRISKLSDNDLKRTFITSFLTRCVIFVTFIGAIFVAIFFINFTTYFFGEKYGGIIIPLLILLPGIIFGAGSKLLANEFAAIGRPELNMYTSWITLLISILGNLILIPKYSLIGAAIATSFSYIVNFIMKIFMIKYYNDVNLLDNIFIKYSDFKYFFKLLGKNK